MAEQSWEEFKKEFDVIEANPDYKPFRPLLTRTKALIGRGHDEDKLTAPALIEFVKFLQKQSAEGEDVLPLLDKKTASGFIQPAWEVEGDVKQANRDFIDRSTNNMITIVLSSIDELKSTTQSRNKLVPIVPVVMTEVQAQELVSRAIFHGQAPILESGFNDLYDYLQRETIDWLARYGPMPEDWKPFGSSPNDMTLRELIENALKGLENEFEFLECPLAASFRDVIALAEGDGRSTLRRMRESGCIVILDVISMRHPRLLRAFQQTLLDAYPRTSVVSMAPNQTSYDIASKLAVAVQITLADMEFQRRNDDPGDFGVSELILNEKRFKSWLSTRLQKIDLNKRPGVPRVS